jgi:hypothetical protein
MSGQKNNVYNLVSDPGFYVRLTQLRSNFGSGKDFVLMLPYSNDIQISNHQNVSRPVDKFLTQLKDTLVSVSDFANGSAGAIVKQIEGIEDLFGFRLNNKWYYASAWAGQEPASFSLELKFNRGIAGQWSAQDEVYNPILDTYALTLGADSNDDGSATPLSAIVAPMPSPAAIYAQYTLKQLQNIAVGVSQVISILGDVENKITSSYDTLQANAKTQSSSAINKVWTVEFGWSSGTSKMTPFFKLNNTIIIDSNFNFSTEVEKANDTAKGYPISGSLTLSFITETIMTNSDIYNNF